MRIDAIDVYWLKLPLAFVWKTSYADQHVTDTILVRMEGGGHHAWESPGRRPNRTASRRPGCRAA